MYATLTNWWQRFNALRGRRIYILPTRVGYAYAALLLLMLLGAINYSNSLGHLLCFLLVSLGLVVMLHSYRNIRQIDLSHYSAEPVFCGQPARFKFSLNNQSQQISYQLELARQLTNKQSWNPLKRLFAYQHLNTETQLPAMQSISSEIILPTLRRGWLELGRVRLSSLFPMGLFTSWTYFDTTTKALIYPKADGKLPLPIDTASGDNTSTSQTEGLDDFAGFRPYRSGEAMHAVAWKALARDNVMRTKQFSSPLGKKLMLNWHDVDQLDEIENRISQLCHWVIQAESEGYDYGLTIPGKFIDFGHGDNHYHQCLTALALYEN